MPASKLVYEGQSLLLNCSVNGVPGPLKFSWYKRDMLNKKANIPKSSGAEVKISKVNVSDAGEYYCEAKNSRRRFVSRAVPITIKGVCHQGSPKLHMKILRVDLTQTSGSGRFQIPIIQCSK